MHGSIAGGGWLIWPELTSLHALLCSQFCNHRAPSIVVVFLLVATARNLEIQAGWYEVRL